MHTAHFIISLTNWTINKYIIICTNEKDLRIYKNRRDKDKSDPPGYNGKRVWLRTLCADRGHGRIFFPPGRFHH